MAMFPPTLLAAAAVAAFAASLVATPLVLALLKRRAVLDRPNERSSHSVPTPRGGGIAVVAVAVAAWAALAPLSGSAVAWPVIAGALVLAAVSWADDVGGVGVGWRLLAQAAAVALVLAARPFPGSPLQGLVPPAAEAVVVALAWLWFINLFNFMDGIDGLATVEAACIGAGVAVVATVAGLGAPAAPYGAVVAAAALAFLFWNWQPARVFLGDVGSVPLGFLLGWLLLELAAQGAWAAALILPLYFVADATLTLLRRALRGERVWRAHREHFYQRAVAGGLSHAGVAGSVLAADLVLLGLAAAAARGWTWTALGGACVVVAALLFYLGKGR